MHAYYHLCANPMLSTILIIEDEAPIADTILYALKKEGFNPLWKSLGSEGINILKKHAVDLVVLDVGLPDINGFELCKEIRRFSEVPIIFLTARAEEVDRIVGLEIGGDDYVAKPFSPRELVARVKTILKRSGKVSTISNTKSTSRFNLDENKARVTYAGKVLDLTRYEYRLIQALLAQPERIFSREQLMEKVWDAPEASQDRTVDAHIKSLRAKLRAVDPSSDPIKTHRGMGYSLSEDGA